MDTMHISMENGKQGSGASQCRYIMREGQYNKESMHKELAYVQQYNLPAWAGNSAVEFFRQADKYEGGNPFKSFIITLPKELPLEENIKIVDRIIRECLGETKPVAYAIHVKKSSFEGVDHPHAHIMFSARDIPQPDIDNGTVKAPELFFKRANHYYAERGGYPKDPLFVGNRQPQQEKLKQIRDKIVTIVNEACRDNGIDRRFTCKSLKQQKEEALQAGDTLLAEKLDRQYVERNLGPKLSSVLKKIKTAFEKEYPNQPLKLSVLAQKVMDYPLNGTTETVANSRFKLLMALNAKFEKHKKDIEYENALRLNAQKEKRTAIQYNTSIITAAELKSACKQAKELIASEIKNNSMVIRNIDSVLIPKASLKELIIEQVTHGWASTLKRNAEKIKAEFTSLEKEKPKLAVGEYEKRRAELEKKKTKLISQIGLLNKQLAEPEAQAKLKQTLETNIKYQEQQETIKKILENRNTILKALLPKLTEISDSAQQLSVTADTRQEFKTLIEEIKNYQPAATKEPVQIIEIQKKFIADIRKFLQATKREIASQNNTVQEQPAKEKNSDNSIPK